MIALPSYADQPTERHAVWTPHGSKIVDEFFRTVDEPRDEMTGYAVMSSTIDYIDTRAADEAQARQQRGDAYLKGMPNE